MKTTTRFLVLTIVIANTVALAQQFDPFESYLEEFVSALDLPVLPAGTNSPAWTVPDKVVFRETVWTIHDVSGAVPRIDHLYRLTCGNGETNIPFRAYPTLSKENASRIVGVGPRRSGKPSCRSSCILLFGFVERNRNHFCHS